MKTMVALGLAALLAGGGAYVLHSDAIGFRAEGDTNWLNLFTARPSRSAEAAARYVTARVERGDVRQTVTATGSLNAVTTVEVGTQLSGQIAQLFADFNDQVERRQPLAQLERQGFEAALAGARAATRMAHAAVEVQRAKLERARINTLDAEAQRDVLGARNDNAKVRLEAAESTLRRLEQLTQRGAASTSQIEEARATRDSAAAGLREADAIAAAHELVVAGAHADLHAAEAELANVLAGVPQKEAAERAAAIDLERTIIRAPVDGVIVGRSVDEGQTVAANLEAPTLFTIVGDLQQMEIYANVDEADIGKITVGQEAIFTVDAHSRRRFPAVITSIRKAPQLDQGVVTYTVVLSTENHDNLLMPGMTALVRITVYEAEGVLKVPLAALRYSPADRQTPLAGALEDARPATVWRLNEGTGESEAVAVAFGNDDGHHAVVANGALAEGDLLVVREVVETPRRELFGIRLGL